MDLLRGHRGGADDRGGRSPRPSAPSPPRPVGGALARPPRRSAGARRRSGAPLRSGSSFAGVGSRIDVISLTALTGTPTRPCRRIAPRPRRVHAVDLVARHVAVEPLRSVPCQRDLVRLGATVCTRRRSAIRRRQHPLDHELGHGRSFLGGGRWEGRYGSSRSRRIGRACISRRLMGCSVYGRSAAYTKACSWANEVAADRDEMPSLA